MGLFSRLFGGTKAAPTEAAAPEPRAKVEYRGFTLLAEPYQENGQFQLAGTIVKTIDGQERSHRFVRADRFGSVDDATQFTITKAKQIVDQQGDRIFD